MVNVYLKGELRKKGIRYEHQGEEITANSVREYRKISPERLISRIDLADYEHKKPDVFKEYEPDTVVIPLSQHIGKPASPLVKVGDMVNVGDLIASISEEDLGANIHASISGIVLKVDNQITIQKISEGVK